MDLNTILSTPVKRISKQQISLRYELLDSIDFLKSSLYLDKYSYYFQHKEFISYYQELLHVYSLASKLKHISLRDKRRFRRRKRSIERFVKKCSTTPSRLSIILNYLNS